MKKIFPFLLSILVFLTLVSVVYPPAQASRPTGTPYTPKSTMMQQWFALESQYPQYISKEIIGCTMNNNTLYIFKIGNPNGGAVMWDGCVHGPEDVGTEAGYWFTKWLCDSASAGNNRALNIIQGNYWLVIPYINYDSNQRQNMRRQYVLENGSIINVPYGVDLNRNFVYNWGFYGSKDPNNNYEYMGLYPGSEPETQAVRSAMQEFSPKVYFNVHCGMDLMVYAGQTPEIRAIGADIKTRYTAEVQSKELPDYYTSIWSSVGPYSGQVRDDAYSFGACGFLFETQTWDKMPNTLAEWKSNWLPTIECVILAALESVQTPTAPEFPSSSIMPVLMLATLAIAVLYFRKYKRNQADQ